METIRCKCCGKIVPSNPCVKHQLYCSEPECQRERNRLWQKHKLKTDPDYHANQMDCQQRRKEKHPDYWRNWRQTHRQKNLPGQMHRRCRRQCQQKGSLYQRHGHDQSAYRRGCRSQPGQKTLYIYINRSRSHKTIITNAAGAFFSPAALTPPVYIIFQATTHPCAHNPSANRNFWLLFSLEVTPFTSS